MNSLNPHDLANLASFKKLFEPYLKTFLKTKQKEFKKYLTNESIKKILDHSNLLAEHGGKRVRPYMMLLGYRIAGGKGFNRIIAASVGLELFHTFALIHDDIADQGNTRHGIATIHRFVESLFPERKSKTHIGISQALLAGDLFANWSYQALQVGTTQKTYATVAALFHTMITEIIIGQMIDVDGMEKKKVSIEDIEMRSMLKTASYTFIHPLKIGAALAGKAGKYDSFFEKLGMLLGSGYQLHDDIIDIIGNPEKTGKNNLTDLEEGKHTLITHYVFTYGTPEEKETLHTLFGKKLTDKQKKQAIALFTESNAILLAKTTLEKKFIAADTLLKKTAIPESYKEEFRAIMELLLTSIS